jgi:hypothetical protein
VRHTLVERGDGSRVEEIALLRRRTIFQRGTSYDSTNVTNCIDVRGLS